MGPVINRSAGESIMEYIKGARDAGATIAAGGRQVTGGDYDKGFYIEPTLITGVKPAMKVAVEEIFGPVLSLISARGLDEVIEIANSVPYGLSSSIYTENIKNAFRAVERIDAGITYVNAPTIGAEIHLPFGGTKASGNGTREAGTTAIDEFTELKTVYFDYSNRLQKAQIDTQVVE